MHVLLIGGTGHVGCHLTPQLIENGFEVSVLASGRTSQPNEAVWDKVRIIKHNYSSESLPDAVFEKPPDCVIDMLGSPNTYEWFHGHAAHIIVCGSLWMLGEPKVVPTPESPQSVPCPFPGYAKRYEKIHADLEQAKCDGIAFTAIMPPNICGPGKIPLEAMGGRSLEVHQAHAAGETVILPEGGECLIGPCDAADIANLFYLAVSNREAARGEIFNAGAAYALTATQLVNTFADIYKTTIPIRYVSWREYTENVSPDIGAYWHFKAHMCPDISKARHKLGYEPQYTPEQTLSRAIEWMYRQGLM